MQSECRLLYLLKVEPSDAFCTALNTLVIHHTPLSKVQRLSIEAFQHKLVLYKVSNDMAISIRCNMEAASKGARNVCWEQAGSTVHSFLKQLAASES